MVAKRGTGCFHLVWALTRAFCWSEELAVETKESGVAKEIPISDGDTAVPTMG